LVACKAPVAAGGPDSSPGRVPGGGKGPENSPRGVVGREVGEVLCELFRADEIPQKTDPLFQFFPAPDPEIQDGKGSRGEF